MKAVEAREWISVIRQIAEQSIYDVIILDIDDGLREVYELLRVCPEIHVLTARDTMAKAKLLQMEEEMHLLGYDDLKKKIVKKEPAA